MKQPVQPDNAWKETLLDELIAGHIYTAAHENDPRKALRDAIAWNCQIALDPAVSAEAQALVDLGKAQPVHLSTPTKE